MTKWKTVNLERRYYERLKILADQEGKSLGSKIGEAVGFFLDQETPDEIDMEKLAGSVKWTNYRVALIYRWLELTMPKDVVEKAKHEMDLKRSSS
jgi:hypothetical protein